MRKNLILLPNLNVRNANLGTPPLSWGFPSITAFLGMGHALGRKLDRLLKDNGGTESPSCEINGAGIVCHSIMPKTVQSNEFSDHQICPDKFPYKDPEHGASFVMEVKGHMRISLLLEADISGADEYGDDALATIIDDCLQELRIAGGTSLPRHGQIRLFGIADNMADREKCFNEEVLRHISPGFAIVERGDILAQRMKEMEDAASLDALYDLCAIVDECEMDGGNPHWERREKKGWLVPIHIGFQSLHDLAKDGGIPNSRDKSRPFCLVENLYTLGEWKSPYGMTSWDEMIWRYKTDDGLYLCVQNN